jgi:hypothetical protein
VQFRYLAARCLAECKDWDECLRLVGGGEQDEPAEVSALRTSSSSSSSSTPSGTEVGLYSSICLLRGHVYAAQDNMGLATTWYQRALQLDPYNYEAFEAVSSHHMLTCDQETTLIDALRIPQQDRWLQLLYRSSCKKYTRDQAVEGDLAELEAPRAGGEAAAAAAAGGQQPQGGNAAAAAAGPSPAMDVDAAATPEMGGRGGGGAGQQQQQQQQRGGNAGGRELSYTTPVTPQGTARKEKDDAYARLIFVAYRAFSLDLASRFAPSFLFLSFIQ